ncbi:MAG TPA: NAD(P)H-binding protein [Aquaticitalea sp.]|nr:NAD(P)H-binding protein [Aquaticitalea sp.]
MKIAVFGASGAIGTHFIKSALKEGHDLHLYSRKKIDLADPAKTKLFIGELSDIETIRKTIKDTDAVVSFLGPALKFSYPGMPITNGHENIIRAMKELNVSRFITIATPAVKFEKDKSSVITIMPKIMARLFMPKPYKEIVAVGKLTKSSELDWTIIRFVAPADGEPTGNVKVTFGDKKIGFKITRADIAGFALKELTHGEYVRSMPIIGS